MALSTTRRLKMGFLNINAIDDFSLLTACEQQMGLCQQVEVGLLPTNDVLKNEQLIGRYLSMVQQSYLSLYVYREILW